MPNLKFVDSIVREILGWSENSKIGSRDLHMTPIDLILHFFVRTHLRPLLCQIEVCSFNSSRDIRVVPKLKNWVTWPPRDPFDLVCVFSLELTAVRLNAKFEVSSFNRSRDIRGPKISKVGHVTPSFKSRLQNRVTWPPHDPFWPNFALFVRALRQIWSF